jgi:hypothetical protein
MHGQHLKYLFVAAGALVPGLLVAGTSLQAVLPFLLLLACPLMMVLMMRGMGGHGDHPGHGGGHDTRAGDGARR